ISGVSWADISGAENCKINEGDNTETKEEHVGLKIAHLDQPQQRADAQRASTAPADCACIDHPAIDEGGHTSEELLRPINEPAIELVEIKLAAQQIDLDRFSHASAVKCNRESDSENQCKDF